MTNPVAGRIQGGGHGVRTALPGKSQVALVFRKHSDADPPPEAIGPFWPPDGILWVRARGQSSQGLFCSSNYSIA